MNLAVYEELCQYTIWRSLEEPGPLPHCPRLWPFPVLRPSNTALSALSESNTSPLSPSALSLSELSPNPQWKSPRRLLCLCWALALTAPVSVLSWPGHSLRCLNRCKSASVTEGHLSLLQRKGLKRPGSAVDGRTYKVHHLLS